MAYKLLDGVTAVYASRAVKCGEDVSDHTVMVRFRDIGTTVCSALTLILQGSLIDPGKTGIVSRAALAITGADKPHVYTGAFVYRINDVTYSHTAVAAGTPPTGYTITAAKFGVLDMWINAAKAITFSATSTTQAYDTAALAIAAHKTHLTAYTDLHPELCHIGYLLIEAAVGNFVGGTTDLDATTNTIYVDADLPFHTITTIDLTAGTGIADQGVISNTSAKGFKYARLYLSVLTGTTEVDAWYAPIGRQSF